MRRSVAWVISLCLVFSFAIGGLQWWKWERFGYNGLDLGIYAQTVWSLSQGHGFANSIHDPSYLGDHLELILVPLAGLYRLWPSPLVLLWFQTLCLALSGFLLWKLARQYLPEAGAVVALGLWLAHPFLYNPAMYEFHAMTLALPALLAGILAYSRRRWGWWLIWMAVLCLIREDLPLIVLSWVVLAIIDRVPWRWWVGVGVIGLGWFGLSHEIIAHANALGQYKYLAFISWIGSSPLEMLTYPFRHPLLFIGHVFSPKNWGTTLGLLLGFGGIAVLKPKTLIPAGLSFAQLLLIGSSPNSVLHLHYVIPFIPFIAWSTLRAVRAGLAGTLLPGKDPVMVRLLIIILAITGPIYLQIMYGVAELPWRSTPYGELTPARDLRAALDIIQPSDRVIATFNALPNLANRLNLYSLNYIYLGRRQYTEIRYDPPTPIDVAVIDWRELYDYQFLYKETLFEGRTGEQRILDLIEANELRPAVWSGSVVVYTKTGALEAPLVTRQPAATPLPTELGPLFSSAKVVNGQARVVISWGLSTPPSAPVSIQFKLTDAAGHSLVSSRLLGEGAQPATNWSSDSTWATQYRASLPDNFRPSKLEYEWVELSGRYHLDRWRSFHRIVGHVKPLGHRTIEIVL